MKNKHEGISPLERLPQENPKSHERRLVPLSEMEGVVLHMLEKVDFKVLEEIFLEIRKRSGIQEDFSMPEVVLRRGKNLYGGKYQIRAKSILLDIPDAEALPPLERQMAEIFLMSTEEVRNIFFSIIAHEGTHATSKNNVCSNQRLVFLRIKSYLYKDPQFIQSTGFSRSFLKEGKTERKFNSFSESVTDKIAAFVYEEYMRRTGSSAFYSVTG